MFHEQRKVISTDLHYKFNNGINYRQNFPSKFQLGFAKKNNYSSVMRVLISVKYVLLGTDVYQPPVKPRVHNMITGMSYLYADKSGKQQKIGN